MKKILLIALLAAVCACFAACNNDSATVDRTWASDETLSYNVYDSGNDTKTPLLVGEATFVTTTKLTEADQKACPSADTKVTSTFRIGQNVTTTVFYSAIYNVQKLTRTYVDGADAKKNYVIEGKRDGKNFVYSLTYPNDATKNENGKLNLGKDKYSAFEFLYFMIRCYDPASLPSGVKVPDVFSGEAVSVDCKLVSSSATVTTECPELETVVANQISVTRSSSPVGGSSYVYYLPEDAYKAGAGSIVKSTRFPVKIVENDISFILKDFTPKKEKAD